MHVQPANPDDATDDADVAGNVTLNTDTMIVTGGDTTALALPTITGDGDKINITVGFTGPNAASTESVTLMFDLDPAATPARRRTSNCLLMREWWRSG